MEDAGDSHCEISWSGYNHSWGSNRKGMNVRHTVLVFHIMLIHLSRDQSKDIFYSVKKSVFAFSRFTQNISEKCGLQLVKNRIFLPINSMVFMNSL